jgi:hypothetical protein
MLIWLIAAAFAAQTTPPVTAQRGDASRPPDKDKITITGCVERADQVAGAASTLGTTVDSLSFVLLTPPSGTAGTSGTKNAGSDKGYRLDGDVKKLNPHVGHKVEISGFVDEPAATGGTAAAANGPKVKVESIKMLAETCGR